jgi:hypothetical protein
LIGRDIENGELPDDEKLVGGMVKDICYGNAQRYLGLAAAPAATEVKSASASTKSEVA